MSMTVRTNIASMQATGQLNRTQQNLSGTLGRISSGLRITMAADDAAGLGVATSLETDIISTKQAMRNANDGISIIQTAESATNEVTDILSGCASWLCSPLRRPSLTKSALTSRTSSSSCAPKSPASRL
jgi:hypothetical protein